MLFFASTPPPISPKTQERPEPGEMEFLEIQQRSIVNL